MSLMQFAEYYAKTENCLFVDQSNKGQIYLNLPDSYQALITLIKYQYPGQHGEFIRRVIDIIDARHPKLNTMFVLSPPNSGKNFFFDAVLHLFINYGMIGNFNRNTGFPLGSCTNKRILMFNEPNIESSAFDTLKMVFGGDHCSVRQKYQGDGQLSRTPVIVLSNKEIFPRDGAWHSRILRENWKEAPFLKKIEKKPHPLAVFKLIYKYTNDVTLRRACEPIINKYFS
uniref:NS1 n=1 Tax=Lupine feces-associated densovirus TaxID=2017717 RepID=A0A221LEC2_9VIRU|nr:NS1 [Lupine feces-associated densovirus]